MAPFSRLGGEPKAGRRWRNMSSSLATPTGGFDFHQRLCPLELPLSGPCLGLETTPRRAWDEICMKFELIPTGHKLISRPAAGRRSRNLATCLICAPAAANEAPAGSEAAAAAAAAAAASLAGDKQTNSCDKSSPPATRCRLPLGPAGLVPRPTPPAPVDCATLEWAERRANERRPSRGRPTARDRLDERSRATSGRQRLDQRAPIDFGPPPRCWRPIVARQRVLEPISCVSATAAEVGRRVGAGQQVGRRRDGREIKLCHVSRAGRRQDGRRAPVVAASLPSKLSGPTGGPRSNGQGVKPPLAQKCPAQATC